MRVQRSEPTSPAKSARASAAGSRLGPAAGSWRSAQAARTSALQSYTRRQMRAKEGVCLVADVGGGVVGFLVGDVRPWEFGEDREVAWVKVVGVDPRHQGSGIGQSLGERPARDLGVSGHVKAC